jgi:hypothetical protein
MPSTTTPRRRTTAPRRTPGRPTPAARTRPSIPGRRRRPPQSKGQQLLGALTKALPTGAAGKAATKAKPSGKRVPLAVLGAGAAAAFTQRDKLAGLFGRKSEPQDSAPSFSTVTTTEPVTPGHAAPPVAPVSPVDGEPGTTPGV